MLTVVTIVLRGFKDQPQSDGLYTPCRSSLLASEVRNRLPSKKVEFAFVAMPMMLSLDPSCAAFVPSSPLPGSRVDDDAC